MFYRLTFIIILASLVSCQKAPLDTVRVSHISWPGYELLSFAEERDLYKNIDVMIHRPATNAESIEAFRHNLVDVVAVTLNEAIEIQSKSKETILVVTVLDVSNGADVLIAKNEIKSLSDLKGKILGMVPSVFGVYFVSRAIESEAALSLNDLSITPVSIDKHVEAFIEGDVDAIATYEPEKSKILKKTGHVIFDSTLMPNEIIDVLITTESYAKNNKAQLTELLSGYYKAHDVLINDPENAMSAMAGYEGIGKAEYKKSMSGIRIPSKKDNVELLAGNDSIVSVQLSRLHTFLVEKNIIDKNNTLLPKIRHDFIVGVE